MKQFKAALIVIWVACGATACQGTINGKAHLGPDGEGGQGGEGGTDTPGTAGRPVGTGGLGGASLACNDGPQVGTATWRRLTRSQYQATVEDLLGRKPDLKGFLPDTTTGPFGTNASLPAQEGDITTYATSAESLAAQAVTNLAALLNCDTQARGQDVCASEFISTFVARAYRRPLTSAETAAFAKVYAVGKEESFAMGIRLVIEAALESPSFLYVVEQGEPHGSGLRKLTNYEVASRLSYVLQGTMPDAQLFAAAKEGRLATAEGIRGQAERLLNTDKFIASASRFHTQLLGMETLTMPGVVTRDAEKYADFTDAMRAAMVGEPSRFVAYVLNKGEGSVEELLSAPYVFPTAPLGKIYGDQASPDEDGRAEIKDGSRMGLLTLAGVQASHPLVPTHYGAVIRGHMVRRDLLCDPVPPPTQAVKFEAPPNADMLTQQELLRVHQENPTCKGCHELMDPIGFAFERYDLIGRVRSKGTDGSPIDTSGVVANLEGDDGVFDDTQGMIRKLAAAPEVRSCLATQWFRYTLAREPEEEDACSLSLLKAALGQGKGNVREAILSLVSSDAFRFRRGE